MKNSHHSWKRQHTLRLVPFYLIFINRAENSKMLKSIHTKRAGHRMRQAGFKPATAPTLLVRIASQKGIKKINSQFTYTQTSSNSYHSSGTFFLITSILRNVGTKQFLIAVSLLGSTYQAQKGQSYTLGGGFILCLPCFVSIYTHTYDNKRELAINSID